MGFYLTLEKIMYEKGVSFAELSRRTGLRKGYFSDLKSGRAQDVTWKNALAICEALGVTPNEFAAFEKGME